MSKKNSLIWNLVAREVLWKREPTSDLPRIDVPEIGHEYPIKLDGRSIRTGDILDIEYLSASTFYNGIESETDLDQIRVFSGIVKSITDSSHISLEDYHFNAEATFEVQKSTSLHDLIKQTSIRTNNSDFLGDFLGRRFYNLFNLDDYIVLDWNEDSYAGVNCVLVKELGEFFVLRCHEWQHSSFTRRQYGKVAVPPTLAERLRQRLGKMKNNEHWSGRSI